MSIESDDPPEPESIGVELLAAIAELREAEMLLRSRMRTVMSLGGNDVLALEYIARTEADGRRARPRELALLLGVTAAAATILIDRLVRRGFATRTQDPGDRRARLIALTESAHSTLEAAYGSLPGSIKTLVQELAEPESSRMTKLARDLRSLVDKASPLP